MKVLINTQYLENYAINADGSLAEVPYWKPKGGFQFVIELDSDLMMFGDFQDILAKMVESHNSEIEKFEYIDYEMVFQEPKLLGTQEDFMRHIFQVAPLRETKIYMEDYK